MADGFNCLPIEDQQSQDFTSFVIPHLPGFDHSVYCMTRMPFGIRNGPALFNSVISREFASEITDGHLTAFVDDLMVSTMSLQDLGDKVVNLLLKAADLGMRIAPHKMRVGVEEFDYLGYTVTPEGLTVPAKRIEKILNQNKPRSKSELRRFLGMMGYYRRFIPKFAMLAAPLNEMLKDGASVSWEWRDDTDEARAYQHLVDALCHRGCLMKVDLSKQFQIAVDTSGTAVGVVLRQYDDTIQKWRPVLFDGAKLKPAQLAWSASEREAFGMWLSPPWPQCHA